MMELGDYGDIEASRKTGLSETLRGSSQEMLRASDSLESSEPVETRPLSGPFAGAPAAGGSVVVLSADEAPQQFHQAETHLQSARTILEQVRSLALQATQVNLGAADRGALSREAHALIEQIIEISSFVNIAQAPSSQSTIQIEVGSSPGPVGGGPESPRSSFNLSTRRVPVVALRSLDLSSQTSAVAALQILRQAIEALTEIQLTLNQARADLQALDEDDLASLSEGVSVERARALARRVVENLALKPEIFTGSQANVEGTQVLELMGG